jgi:hypothetical protein
MAYMLDLTEHILAPFFFRDLNTVVTSYLKREDLEFTDPGHDCAWLATETVSQGHLAIPPFSSHP